MRPHRRQPTRLRHPWDSLGKNTGVGCHFLLQSIKVKSESEVTQSCPTLCDPMDCSPPGSSVHGIFQARVLEWIAVAFSVVWMRGAEKKGQAFCDFVFQIESLLLAIYDGQVCSQAHSVLIVEERLAGPLARGSTGKIPRSLISGLTMQGLSLCWRQL